ncbi:hypothetical protein QYM36_013230, partial [Artemia franciscana]
MSRSMKTLDKKKSMQRHLSNARAPAPVTLRAQHFKAEMKNLESLRSKIEQKEQEIRDLRALIKLKQEEVSELNIRRDLSDKKLNSTLKDAELSIERLNRKLEDAEIMLARKDKEFEETIEHLQQDLKEMEIERNELKEKNLALSKRIVFESIAKGSVSSGPLVNAPIHAASITTSQTTPASSRDLNLLQSQVMSLTEALRHSRREATALRAADMKQKLAALTPIKDNLIKIVSKVCSLPDEEEDALDFCLRNCIMIILVVELAKCLRLLVEWLDPIQYVYNVLE